MENEPRGSDRLRLFSPEFKREAVSRLVRGERTPAQRRSQTHFLV